MSLFKDQAAELQAAIADNTKPTLVEFYATWCPHCQHMAPIVDEIRAEEAGKCNVVTIEAEAHPELAQEYKVESFPTWYLINHGKVFCTNTGEQAKETILDAINAAKRMGND